MAVPPSYNNTGLPNQLMNEEDIRQYFVRNGGVVKNTDIVSYFRPYLSNPAFKDEARIIFKTYVNKLASVKVENGEKYLVLKRQYFPPIDGNGNSGTSGLPPVNSYATQQQYSQQQSIYGHPSNYSTSQSGYNPQQSISSSLPTSPQRQSMSQPPSHYSSHSHLQMNPHPSVGGGGMPPSSYGHPPPPLVSTVNANHLRRQNSQSQIYGSHFSLNSNYADPYNNANNVVSSPQSLHQHQYYHQQQQHMSGLGHGHGGSTFSLASQYTTASSAGVPPYHHHQQSQSSLMYHQQQPHHPVQPPLQRTLSQTQQTYAAAHQPVSQMQQQYSQQHQQKTNFSGGASGVFASSQVDYPPEYGLPPVNSASSVNTGSPQQQQQQQQSAFHRHLSPQNSGIGGSRTGSLQRAPPPYRPPPPAANLSSPSSGFPPPPVKATHSQQQHMRRSSLSSSSMSGGVTGGVVRFNRSPSNPGPVSHYSSGSTNNLLNGANTYRDPYNNGPGAFQNQRSVSAVSSGLPAAQGSVPLPNQPPSDPHHQQNVAATATSEQGVPGAPPPPVPPRHKRGVERSPSTVSGASGSSSVKHPQPNSSNATNFGGNRHSNRRNMDVTGSTASTSNTTGLNGGMENDHEKENINLVNGNGTNGNFEESSASSDGPNDNMQNGDSETEQKISVKERMQKFNRIASESELAASKMPSNRNKREIAAKHESVDFDTASLSSLEPRAKEWMLKSAQCDYHALYKLAQENPSLVRRRDMNTCLHWAAKKGHVELVKLLAGAYQCDVNAKSNGGYTPLHLAAQFSRQEVYDLLVKAYNADVNIRDHSGKKPMQYLVRQDTSVSMDTFKKIKEKRRSTEMQRDRDSSFLRIGSLNVKVKSTREAFGYLLGKSTSTTGVDRVVHKNWGSADNLPETEVNGGDKDKQMMPPPSLPNTNSARKKKTRRVNGGSPTIKESDSDSDSACGFGSDWQSP